MFTGKASGKETNRPQLEELSKFARDGDPVIVHGKGRLVRNLDDQRSVVENLQNSSVTSSANANRRHRPDQKTLSLPRAQMCPFNGSDGWQDAPAQETVCNSRPLRAQNYATVACCYYSKDCLAYLTAVPPDSSGCSAWRVGLPPTIPVPAGTLKGPHEIRHQTRYGPCRRHGHAAGTFGV
ncbi:recombinase family protein [Arthrobacter sp. 2RAF6]|uniref:recombinase family protein n=1 Tax=Arthrobacter sp. 2RAF6 TaxID=3233002 RepID=UPI003F90EB5E